MEKNKLWVVKSYSDIPNVDEYTLIELTAKGNARVLVRGTPMVIRQSQGCRFFTDKEAVIKYVNSVLNRNLSCREAAIRRIKEAIETGISMNIVPNSADHRRLIL